MLLGYSFEPRTNSWALVSGGSVIRIGLSTNGSSHSTTPVWREKTRLTSPEIRAAATSKGLTWFRQSLHFSSSYKSTKGELSSQCATELHPNDTLYQSRFEAGNKKSKSSFTWIRFQDSNSWNIRVSLQGGFQHSGSGIFLSAL